MPSIMGAFDAIIGGSQKERNCTEGDQIRTSTPKRSHQVGNFANLSPCVQKILSNVPEQEISKKFSSEETLNSSTIRRSTYRPTYRSFRSPEKQSPLNRSNEKPGHNLDERPEDVVEPPRRRTGHQRQSVEPFQEHDVPARVQKRIPAPRSGTAGRSERDGGKSDRRTVREGGEVTDDGGEKVGAVSVLRAEAVGQLSAFVARDRLEDAYREEKRGEILAG
ncbi:unnamed protein product [Acanthoscelides obtectus]|uniref:Uncharacterized protein n=1 Tax=Acanthoscelides obtectus TaxID=200917 RepID=A0A9P0QA75_ACAOB|nr:unnamed protein product [Acanthoscelides obtectus]CAK1643525.1 hypothetical protein AOBTE_LOCUS13562 [Acanthoscelides obtectus]